MSEERERRSIFFFSGWGGHGGHGSRVLARALEQCRCGSPLRHREHTSMQAAYATTFEVDRADHLHLPPSL